MHKGYSIEMNLLVYDDEFGTSVLVRGDQDDLGLVEMIFRDEVGKEISRSPTLDPKHARLVAEALVKLCDDLESKL